MELQDVPRMLDDAARILEQRNELAFALQCLLRTLRQQTAPGPALAWGEAALKKAGFKL